MLGTMTILADGGISTGVMAQGGKVWQDKEKLGVVLVTGLDLRRKFAIGSFLFSIPILTYLLLHHGASWVATILIIASLMPAFFAALSDSLLEIVPKLHQDIKPLQKNQINVSLGRLIFTGLTVFFFPWTFVAILASGLTRIYGNIQLSKIANAFVSKDQLSNPEIRKNILKTVKYLLPTAIYYAFSSNIIIWLVSIFGKTDTLAEVGALSRLSMALNVFSVLFGTLIIPRFARLPEVKNLLFSRYLQIQVGFIILSIIIITTVWTFPAQFLWILGKDYLTLNFEFVLIIIGSCVGFFTGSTFSLYISRGWAITPVISIPIMLCSIVVGVIVLDVSTLQGVLWLNILTGSVQYFMNLIYIVLKFNKIKQ